MNITYHWNGDCLLPDLATNDRPAMPLTKYGLMRMKYLQDHRPGLYGYLLLSGRLYPHLVETQKAAQARLEIIITGMADSAGIDEKLKARDQMAWVGAMNAIRQQAEEIVLKELVFV